MSLTCIPLITKGTECLFLNILTVCMTFWRNVSLSPLPIKKGSQSVVAFYIVWIVDSDTWCKVFSIIYAVFFFLDGILWYTKLNFYEVHELIFFSVWTFSVHLKLTAKSKAKESNPYDFFHEMWVLALILKSSIFTSKKLRWGFEGVLSALYPIFTFGIPFPFVRSLFCLCLTY